ncbi:hypothetical protein K469DRAFT_38742 [Zopfia rhizophila CBS 207.26]|uniref:Uncharacterized protein n=1 Tax=Zopfia rhizophila CBS 207.26 TaxID=1314779 RepID=A0A6A6DCD7_9PEZI|nr:hypothetical protein K469DRAFT_38742 [Zopfia rhizophila CBS 207.26]
MAPTPNGEKPYSKVLSHLQSYPVVHDSLEVYKTNPYGAKSLSVFNLLDQKFLSPLNLYVQIPCSYLSPYLTHADELGDTGVSKVDNKFPVVKEETNKLKEIVQSNAFFPLRLAGQGKEYTLRTFNDKYSKTKGGEGSREGSQSDAFHRAEN